MYNEQSIRSLSETIGFGKSLESSITIDGPNEIGSSGMVFKSFHNLVTVDNLISTLEDEISGSALLINEELDRIRTDAAKKVLSTIFDDHLDYIPEEDYSPLIESKLILLRKSYALTVVVMCLELMIASKRFNLNERSIKETFVYLNTQLEGIKNDYGKRITYGIADKLAFAISDVQSIIFPFELIVQSGNKW